MGGRSVVSTQFRYHWAAGLAATLVGLPLFVSVSERGIAPPTRPSVVDRGLSIGVPVSLGVMVIALVTAALKLRTRRAGLLAPVSLTVFIIVNCLALLAGSMSDEFSAGSLAFFVQTMLPLAAYVYGTQLFVNRSGSLAGTYNRLFLLPLLSLMAIALTTLLEGGRPWADLGQRIGPLEIPQILRYVPTVLAAGLVGFAHNQLTQKRPRWSSVAFVVSSLTVLASVHSRTSLLIVIAGVLVTVVGDPAAKDKGKRLVSVGWVGIAVFLVVAGLPEVSEGPVAFNRLFGDDAAAQLSSERRYGALGSSFSESFGSPFGRAYIASENLSLGGAESAISRVSNSENQFGEFGLRAGPLAIVSMVLFLFAVLRDARRTLQGSITEEDAKFMASIWVATVATLLGSTFTQQPLSQPFTGLYLWLMLGLLRGWTVESHSVRGTFTVSPEEQRVPILAK